MLSSRRVKGTVGCKVQPPSPIALSDREIRRRFLRFDGSGLDSGVQAARLPIDFNQPKVGLKKRFPQSVGTRFDLDVGDDGSQRQVQ